MSDVQLQPSSEYAYLDTNNETVIDMSTSNSALMGAGLNPDSVFTFDNVTALHNSGDEHVEVWVTNDVDGVSVQVDGETIDSNDTSVRLNASDTVGLDVIINTSDREAIDGTHTLTIHTRFPDRDQSKSSGVSNFADSDAMRITVLTPEPGVREIQIENMDEGHQIDVDNLSLQLANDTVVVDGLETTAPDNGDAQLVVARENETAEATIKDKAGVTPLGAFTIDQETGSEFDSLSIRGTVSTGAVAPGTVWSELQVLQAEDGDWISVNTTHVPEGNDTISFETTLDAFDKYVVAAPVPDIAVTTASVENTTVPLGSNVTVDAEVVNNGTAEGNQTIPIRVENETVRHTNVTLDPTESAELTTQLHMTESGTVTIAVGSVVAGEVTVSNQSDADEDPAEMTTPINGLINRGADFIEGGTIGGDTTPGEGTEPGLVEEPAAISLSRLLGLVLVVGMTIALIGLVRRVSF
ncbi:DUF1102 domain-containing protein [Halodesulfurarchaeum sp.]